MDAGLLDHLTGGCYYEEAYSRSPSRFARRGYRLPPPKRRGLFITTSALAPQQFIFMVRETPLYAYIVAAALGFIPAILAFATLISDVPPGYFPRDFSFHQYLLATVRNMAVVLIPPAVLGVLLGFFWPANPWRLVVCLSSPILLLFMILDGVYAAVLTLLAVTCASVGAHAASRLASRH